MGTTTTWKSPYQNPQGDVDDQQAVPPAPAPVAPAPTAPAAPSSGSSGPLTFDTWKGIIANQPGTVAGLQALSPTLSQYGWSISPTNAGNIIGPNGEVRDVLHNAGLGGEGWRGAGGGWRPSSGTSSGATSGMGGSVSPLATGSSTSPSAQGGTAFNDQVRQLLMQQLQGLSQPISADDPTIRGEMTAQERLLERERQQRRAVMAERAAFTGLNSGGQGSGAMDADIAAGFEDKGARLSGLQAQLFGRELQGRRTQMTQMLSMALQSGDNEAARALQLQIANMDAQLRKMGLAENARQFDDSFGLQAGQFQYQKDRDLASYGGGI